MSRAGLGTNLEVLVQETHANPRDVWECIVHELEQQQSPSYTGCDCGLLVITLLASFPRSPVTAQRAPGRCRQSSHGAESARTDPLPVGAEPEECLSACPPWAAMQRQLQGKLHHNGSTGLGHQPGPGAALSLYSLLDHCPASFRGKGLSLFGRGNTCSGFAPVSGCVQQREKKCLWAPGPTGHV